LRSELLALLSVAGMACASESHPWSLAPTGIARDVGPDSSYIFELVRVIGPEVLPADFTYLGPAAISATGKVALRSHKDCRIAVVDIGGGMVERLFGRCGDGPHESQAIAALLWSVDTVLVVDASSGRFRWFGPADTVVRTLRPNAAALGGSSGLVSVAIVDDTTALLFLRLQPATVTGPNQHGLVAEMDLRSGEIRRRFFEEPAARRAADGESQRYYRGCAVDQDRVAIENNGPAEVIRIGLDGRASWARQTSTDFLGLSTSPDGDGASFRWGRLPRPLACGTGAFVSVVLPIEGNSSMAAVGRIVVFDWDGNTLINQDIPGRDYPLAFAGWHGRDSLFVVTASQATVPHAAVLRLRPRRDGEVGPFLLPDSVRVMY
jgi:hypothetical protein